ncbi:MAG: hypothetical protein ACREVH_12960 [Gammaproteobacteria bacterium]
METTETQHDVPRILARQLARPLTEEEIVQIVGGARNGAGDTWCETGCPPNDSTY